MKLAIIGATGLVGEEILKVLKERNINFNKLYLVASKESVGKTIHFCNADYNIVNLELGEAVQFMSRIRLFRAPRRLLSLWSRRSKF